MTIPEIATIITTVVAFLTLTGYMVRFGARQQEVKSDVKYLRRDMDQVLACFRLTPAEQKDRERRR